jgi:RNA recognition motif-containing protein
MPPAASNSLGTDTSPHCCPARSQIVIHGLPFSYDNPQLKDMFRSVGNVLEALVKYEPGTGRSKGFGTVLFKSAEEASRAIEVRGAAAGVRWWSGGAGVWWYGAITRCGVDSGWAPGWLC